MPVRLRAGALLLDFNGTLSNDEDVLYDVYAAMLARRGRPLSRTEYYERLAGRSDEESSGRRSARAPTSRP
jgi:beta-phosphoglucomutase-like phosphatase (HAD superfamily)